MMNDRKLHILSDLENLSFFTGTISSIHGAYVVMPLPFCQGFCNFVKVHPLSMLYYAYLVQTAARFMMENADRFL